MGDGLGRCFFNLAFLYGLKTKIRIIRKDVIMNSSQEDIFQKISEFLEERSGQDRRKVNSTRQKLSPESERRRGTRRNLGGSNHSDDA